MPLDRYKYYINRQQVFPQNLGSDNYQYLKRSDDGFVFEIALQSEISFDLKNGGFDFKAQEEENISEELEFQIFKLCNNRYILEFNGVFAVAEGKFDLDNCIFSIKPRKREFIIQDIQVNILDIPTKVTSGAPFFQDGVQTDTSPFSAPGQRIYPQAKHFVDVVNYVSKKSNPKINTFTSNFFQINPSGSWPFSFTNEWNRLVFCSLSDIQEPVPSSVATEETISFGELMRDLFHLFYVDWFIDDNYDLNIEHFEFFQGTQGLDLTLSKYNEHTAGTKKYTYLLEEYPRFEFWRAANQTQYAKLSYFGLGMINKNNNQKTYQPQKIYTDYSSIRYYGENSTANGLFLFSCNRTVGVYTMRNQNGQNFTLSPAYLLKKFFSYDRPYLYSLYERYDVLNTTKGFTNGGFLATDVKPTKLQDEFSIPFCCEDDFDFKQYMRTNLGTGYIHSAIIEKKSQALKLQLKYKVNQVSPILPNEIEGCALWLRGDDDNAILIDGSNRVLQWNDLSGNGRHAVPPVPNINKPTHTPGSNYLQFVTGPIQWLEVPAFQLFPSKRGTIFIRQEIVGAGNAAIISTNDTAGSSTYWDICNFSGWLNTTNEASTYPQTYIGGIYEMVRDGNTETLIYQDGREIATSPYTPPNSIPTLLPVIIGHNNSTVLGTATLKIYEVIIFDRDLTEHERQLVEYYLTTKQLISMR